MEPLELRGRAAVVTGAASGIGRSLALIAGARGMAVAIADVNADGLAETEEMLRERQVKVLPHVLDVRSAEDVEAFAKQCFDAFPSIAMVWANAGIIRYGSTIRPDLAEWNLTIDINLKGVIHCLASFVHRMADRAEPAQFAITGSQASFVTAREIASYAACKHGLWAVAETLKLELEAENSPVGVTMLAPPRTATGIITTTIERTRAAGGDAAVDSLIASIPGPDEIALNGFESAAARQFLALPHFEDSRQMFIDRTRDLL